MKTPDEHATTAHAAYQRGEGELVLAQKRITDGLTALLRNNGLHASGAIVVNIDIRDHTGTRVGGFEQRGDFSVYPERSPVDVLEGTGQ